MFKKLLYLIVVGLVLPIMAHGATYYVSSSTGNDANDGTSENSPWQTIAKVNDVKFDENSTILFKRGDVFRGAVSTKGFVKGTTFGAYGSGDNPVITGSVQITGWTPTKHPALGANVYEADVANFIVEDKKGNENAIEHLFVNGELMTIARYPNVDSPADKNWLKVGDSAGKNAFTDPVLVAYGKPDGYWKGAKLRIRNYSWTYKVFEITGYTAKTGKITAKDLGNQLPEWGYFLDDKLEELDHPGEWYYDAEAKKVYLYPRGNVDTNTLLVEGTTFKTGIKISWHEDNSLVENLTFRHFSSEGVNINTSDNVIVRNCHFEYNIGGISVYSGANVLITSNTFNHQLSIAIGLSAPKDFDVGTSTAEKNQITNTGMFPVYCRRYKGTCYGIGISLFGKGHTVRQNTVENTGWTGIYLKSGGHHVVENNVVRKALALINDAGAITNSSPANIIRGNFLLDTIGNIDESNGCGSTNKTPCGHHSSYGMGIAKEGEIKDAIIEGNTIANNSDMGIRLSDYIDSTIRDNVLYNNDPQIRFENKGGASRGNIVEDNIIYSLNANQIGIKLMDDSKYGKIDNNYYCNPYSEVAFVAEKKRYSLPHWQSEFPSHDKNSKWCGIRLEEYSVSNIGSNLIINSTFDVDNSNWKGNSATLSHEPSKAEMDGGSLKVVYKGSQHFAMAIPNSFDLVENQYYRLKFSIIGDNFGSINLTIQDNNPDDRQEIISRYFAYDKNRKDYELVFQSPMNTPKGRILFSTKDLPFTYWLDNFTLEPVDAVLNDATQQSKLFMNTTENPRTIDLKGTTYLDLNGDTVTGSLTLQPFSSQILIYSSGKLPEQDGDDSIQPPIISMIKRVYRKDDTLRFSLPYLPANQVQYLGAGLPGGTILIFSDLGNYVAYDENITELPVWQGGDKVELSVAGLSKGEYTVYLLRLPVGVEPLTNQEQWALGSSVFQVE